MSRAILTIDDIASKNTPNIVDYLVSMNIKPVMFAVGENVEKFYNEAIYVLKAGIVLGNHSYSHPNFSEISFEEGVADIEKNEKVLDKLYSDAGVERKYRPFRFPYGAKGGSNEKRYQEYLKEQGYNKLVDTQITYSWWVDYGMSKNIDTFWTFDFAEYNIRPDSGFTVDDVWKRIDDTNPQNGGSLLEEGTNHIILLHAHDETEEMVPEYYKKFIEYVTSKGLVFDEPQFW